MLTPVYADQTVLAPAAPEFSPPPAFFPQVENPYLAPPPPYPADANQHPDYLRRPRRWWQHPLALILGIAATAGVIIAAILVVTGGPTRFEVNGTMTLEDTSSVSSEGDSGSCVATDGYDDLNEAQVVISDAAGKTLGIGTLDPGELDGSGDCTFTYTVDHIPAGQKFYGVTISHRGTVQFTESDLRAGPATRIGQ